MLTVRHDFPAEIFENGARDLAALLGGPTLFYLPGKRKVPLFVSVLLHGNEDTGWLAMREVLSAYLNPNAPSGLNELPRSLLFFVGNVSAAREGVRSLEGQPDYNRIWADGALPEHTMAREIVARLRKQPLFAAIDVHNNTGRNPHYACINRLDPQFLGLAEAFGPTVVYFRRPETVISLALSHFAPSVTLECGRPGDPGGVEHARDFIRSCLSLEEVPSGATRSDLRLFHTTAIVRVPPDVDFGFDESAGDIQFVADLDAHNFRELPAGTVLARLRSDRARLEAEDEHGDDQAARYFGTDNGNLVMRTPAMLSMLTLEERIIRQDCLCYLMERLPVP